MLLEVGPESRPSASFISYVFINYLIVRCSGVLGNDGCFKQSDNK